MMRLGENAAATSLFWIGLHSFLCSTCCPGRAAVPISSSHGVHRGRDRRPVQPAKECVLPHSVYLWAPSSAEAWEQLQTFLALIAALKWTGRGFPASSDFAQAAILAYSWYRGKYMHVTDIKWSTGTARPTSLGLSVRPMFSTLPE